MTETTRYAVADAIVAAHADTRRSKRAKTARQSLATRRMMKGGRK